MAGLRRKLRKNYLCGLSRRVGRGLSCAPITVFLTVNNTCNLRCLMCDVGQGRDDTSFARSTSACPQEMGLDDWKRLINELTPFGVDLCIVATEPLLYPGIIELIRHIGRCGLRLHLTTNGFLLKKFAAELVEAGFERLHVSIDGDEPTHDHIRGVEGSWRRAVEGILAIDGERRRQRSVHPEVHLYTTILPVNFHRLLSAYRSLHEMPVKSLNFVHYGFVTEEMARAHNRRFGDYCPVTSSSVSALDPSDMDVSALGGSIARVKAAIGSNGHGPAVTFLPDLDLPALQRYYGRPLEPMDGRAVCHAPWRTAQVCPDGRVLAMSRCLDVALGNVLDQSFMDIWNGGPMAEFRRMVKTNGIFPFCTRCDVLF